LRSDLTPDALGTTYINGCCLFEWSQRGPLRTVQLRWHHCEGCIEELRHAIEAQGLELELLDVPPSDELGGGRPRRKSRPPKAA
jgi:hypothetical protein